MFTAEQAKMLTLENDYQFSEILSNIKKQAQQGSFEYSKQYYHEQNTDNLNLHAAGLKILGYTVEVGSNYLRIIWRK